MERAYIIGNTEKTRAVMNIGRCYALDGSLGSSIYLDASKSHVILIAGKRGYGKSYTLGILLEEYSSLENDIKKKIGVLVIDTLGIFWTGAFPDDGKILEEWGMRGEGMKLNIFTSPVLLKEYDERGVEARAFKINPSELEPFHWQSLFKINPISLEGVAISKASKRISIKEMIRQIEMDEEIGEKEKIVCKNLLRMAQNWDVFDENAPSIYDIIRRGEITILDLSLYPDKLKEVIVSILAQKIFMERMRERWKDSPKMPLVWLFIDEAHLFLPEKENACKEILINGWMRQGRQPGLSLIMATQRVDSLDEEVLSHVDVIICHRLTSQGDIDALNRIRPVYMKEKMGEAIKRVKEKGIALIVDDVTEKVHLARLRPRRSRHGGGEASVL